MNRVVLKDRDPAKCERFFEVGMKLTSATCIHNVARATTIEDVDDEEEEEDHPEQAAKAREEKAREMEKVRNDSFALLRAAMDTYVKEEADYADAVHAMEGVVAEVNRRLDDDDDVDFFCDMDKVRRAYQQGRREYKTTLDEEYLTKHKYAKVFESRMARVIQDSQYEPGFTQTQALEATSRGNDDEDDEGSEDDVQATQVTLSTKDPITLAEMKDPVINEVCNHSYERKPIMDLIKRRPNTKCPVTGCENRRPINPEDLSTNFQLKKHLQLKRRKEGKR